MHASIAFKRSEQHWLINDPDAKRYANAIGNALRHIPIQTSQKAIDFAALVAAIGQYDAPRVMLSMQLSKDKRKAPARGPAQVFTFTGPPAQPAASATGAAGASVPIMAEGPPDTSDGAA